MQIVCTSLQTDNHAYTLPLGFYRPGALPAAQPTASKYCYLTIRPKFTSTKYTVQCVNNHVRNHYRCCGCSPDVFFLSLRRPAASISVNVMHRFDVRLPFKTRSTRCLQTLMWRACGAYTRSNSRWSSMPRGQRTFRFSLSEDRCTCCEYGEHHQTVKQMKL